MLSDQKLKQIQSLIRGSNVLTDQEKTEWLALIELMNDKQVAELEEILQGPKPAPQQQPAAQTSVSQVTEPSTPKPVTPTMPPTMAQPSVPQAVVTPKPRPVMPHINESALSHISNLPNQMSVNKPARPIAPPASPAPQKTPQSMPPINPRPHLTMSQPTAPAPKTTPKPSPAPKPTPVPVPMPPVQPKPIPSQQSVNQTAYNYTPTQTIDLKSPEDVAAITSTVLHVQNRKAFHQAITALASTVGYFQVLTSFEQSPLYKDYLEYGKKMLSGQSQNLALSQEEFEFVTDILLSLKVNRV